MAIFRGGLVAEQLETDVETMLGLKVNNTHSFPCVNWTFYIFIARRPCL